MHRYERKRPTGGPFLAGAFAFTVFVLAFGVLQVIVRDVPAATAKVTVPESTRLLEPKFPVLPQAGAAAIAVEGIGTIGSSGVNTPRPIASVTKMMTAYVILKGHPLPPGQSGPVILVTQADVARRQQMVLEDQSTVAVTAGQQLTQLQLLQGLLIPSANNYGEILANWDAGSVEAFVQKMNAEAQALGMVNTRYADTTGFRFESVSTPEDQLVLARAAMQNPVFASIVGTQSLALPGAGVVNNVNELLGVGGVVGIKTGFTEFAGGNLAFAARRGVAGQEVQVTGVVLGQVDRPAAFLATLAALDSVYGGLQVMPVATKGQSVATADTDWGEKIELVLDEDVNALVWPGTELKARVEVEDLSIGKRAGEQAGWLNLQVGEQGFRVPLRLARDLDAPDIIWRLTRI